MEVKNIFKQGFTIVELMVVIVVIGILAAISVNAYNGVQIRTNDVAVKSDLKNAMKQLELYRVNNGAYPPADDATMAALELRPSREAYGTEMSTYAYCVAGTGDDRIALFGGTSKSGKGFFADSRTGDVTEYTGAFTSTTLIYDLCSDVTGIPAGDFTYNRGYLIQQDVSGSQVAGWQPWVD